MVVVSTTVELLGDDHSCVYLSGSVVRRQSSTSSTRRPVWYFKGPRETLFFIYQHHGVRGLYRGYFSLLGRDVVPYGIYVAFYECIFRLMKEYRSVAYSALLLPNSTVEMLIEFTITSRIFNEIIRPVIDFETAKTVADLSNSKQT